VTAVSLLAGAALLAAGDAGAGGATGALAERFKYIAATTAMTSTIPMIKKGRARFIFVSEG
jgi:hypothetical protein